MVEAPVPEPHAFAVWEDSGRGLKGYNYGLPRYSNGQFEDHFPFAEIKLKNADFPLEARIMGCIPDETVHVDTAWLRTNGG